MKCDLCQRTPATEYSDDGHALFLCPECAFHEGFTDVDPELAGLEEAPQEYDYGSCTAADFMQDD
jgi:hypothetical protein